MSLRRRLATDRSYFLDHRLVVSLDRVKRSHPFSDIWLDGIAGHRVDKRSTNRDNRTNGQFDAEVRNIAVDLAKWLALAQIAHGGATVRTSVHLMRVDGSNRKLVVNPSIPDGLFKGRHECRASRIARKSRPGTGLEPPPCGVSARVCPRRRRPMRHVLSLSSGKDSVSLGNCMRYRIPDVEHVFTEFFKEMPATYQAVERIEDYLGRQANRLNTEFGFDQWYDVYRGMIPSTHRRWCTKTFKLKPFEAYDHDDPDANYAGLRADETRASYVSHKTNIRTVYRFQYDGIRPEDLKGILWSCGFGISTVNDLGSSRFSCYLCFYQLRIEWVRLKETHSEPCEAAKAYECPFDGRGNIFSWSRRESLAEIEHPKRMAAIKRVHAACMASRVQNSDGFTKSEVCRRRDAGDDDPSVCYF